MEAPLRSTLLLGLLLVAVATPARAQGVDDAGESAMLARINAMRAAQQLAPLERHAGLDQAALAHSQDMAANRLLAHVSPRTGNPGDRVRAADVQAERIAENVARRESTLEAHQSILESEAHRAQLLDPQMTHIGLSAVTGPDGMYVTQLIARIARELPPDPTAALPPPSVEEAPEPVPEAAPAPALEAVDPIAALAEAAEAPAEPAVAAASVASVESSVPQAPVAVSMPAPTLRLPANHRGVAGYWVRHGGVWWYFPVPAGAIPGQLLTPDPNAQGAPPENGQQLRARAITAAAPTAPAPQASTRVYLPGSTAGPAYYYTPTTSYATR